MFDEDLLRLLEIALWDAADTLDFLTNSNNSVEVKKEKYNVLSGYVNEINRLMDKLSH